MQFGDARGLLSGDGDRAASRVYDQAHDAAFHRDRPGFALARPDIKVLGRGDGRFLGFAVAHLQHADLTEGNDFGAADL